MSYNKPLTFDPICETISPQFERNFGDLIMYEEYDVYQYDEMYWDSIPYDDIYDTAEELDLKDWDE